MSLKTKQKHYKTVIIGGGAAGFFAALAQKESEPNASVLIIEKNAALLAKVRVSGGGRCNVTHACFSPELMVKNYPRGSKELLGPLYRFGPRQTVDWFESRGVKLKAEDDGRMFPITDSSETIIQCLMKEADRVNVEIVTQLKISALTSSEAGFRIQFGDTDEISCDKLILATGSSPQGHRWAEAFGHQIESPIPSLFTFNMPNSPLASLSGVALKNVIIKIKESSFVQEGPLLITHFGFSGPAILKLSAWAAKLLHDKKYEFQISINWLATKDLEKIKNELAQLKENNPQKSLVSANPWKLPKKFWKHLLTRLDIDESLRLHNLSSKKINLLISTLTQDTYSIHGKTTHKEEFVTCGGIKLKEVNFKSMESKICKGLFFAGEILNIDGITGGFNFQNAWTTGYIAGSSK